VVPADTDPPVACVPVAPPVPGPDEPPLEATTLPPEPWPAVGPDAAAIARAAATARAAAVAQVATDDLHFGDRRVRATWPCMTVE
jgi:hypothetical protein